MFVQFIFNSCNIFIASLDNILILPLLSVITTNLLLAFAPNGEYFNTLETLYLYPAVVCPYIIY